MSCSACCCQDGRDAEISTAGTSRGSTPGFEVSLESALGGSAAAARSLAQAQERAHERVHECSRPPSSPLQVNQVELLQDSRSGFVSEVRNEKLDVEFESRVEPEPKAIFDVTIVKGNRKLGIDVNHIDGQSLLVTKVNLGPVLEHNRNFPSLEIVPGDRIREVNGIHEDVDLMLSSIMTSEESRLAVQRCDEVAVTVTVDAPLPAARSVGIDAEHYDSMTLLVTRVSEGLTIIPEHSMQRFDRIVAVNGVRSDAERMLEAMRSSPQPLHLITRRLVAKQPGQPVAIGIMQE